MTIPNPDLPADWRQDDNDNHRFATQRKTEPVFQILCLGSVRAVVKLKRCYRTGAEWNGMEWNWMFIFFFSFCFIHFTRIRWKKKKKKMENKE